MPIPSDAAQSPGDVMLRLADLEREVRELGAARRMESATIGSGGIRVRGEGAEIRIQTADGLTDLAVLSSDGIFFDGEPLLLPGSVAWFAGPAVNIPSTWRIADGHEESRTGVTAQLFAAIGTTWGAGNGTTTFNVPNLVDRFAVGAGSTYAVGATGGSLTTGAGTSHTHTNPTTAGGTSHTHTNPTTAGGSTHSHSIGDTGTAASHTHGISAGSDSTSQVTGPFVFTVSNQAHTHGGSTGSGGSHLHTNPNTGNESSHQHTQGDTGAETAHTHTQGSTGGESTHTHTSTPPYGALIPIIRI
jgi:hypothetical protein